jgi:hypothetical protein
MTKPPSRLRVGAHTYVVGMLDDLIPRGAQGETYPEHLRIYLADSLAPTREREVLLHEAFHAVWQGTSLRTEESGLGGYEEQVISALAPVLLDLLRDNPEFVAYLTEGAGA